MFYLCVYIWMTQNAEREPGGEGMNLCMQGGGQNGACHSNVRHLFSQWGRRDNGDDSWWQRQLVVPLAPAYDPLWSDTAPKKRKGKWKRKNPHLWLIKTAGQTPCLRQQETNATRNPGWHVRQYHLCHSTPLPLLPPSICPFLKSSPTSAGALGVVS